MKMMWSRATHEPQERSSMNEKYIFLLKALEIWRSSTTVHSLTYPDWYTQFNEMDINSLESLYQFAFISYVWEHPLPHTLENTG